MLAQRTKIQVKPPSQVTLGEIVKKVPKPALVRTAKDAITLFDFAFAPASRFKSAKPGSVGLVRTHAEVYVVAATWIFPIDSNNFVPIKLMLLSSKAGMRRTRSAPHKTSPVKESTMTFKNHVTHMQSLTSSSQEPENIIGISPKFNKQLTPSPLRLLLQTCTLLLHRHAARVRAPYN